MLKVLLMTFIKNKIFKVKSGRKECVSQSLCQSCNKMLTVWSITHLDDKKKLQDINGFTYSGLYNK